MKTVNARHYEACDRITHGLSIVFRQKKDHVWVLVTDDQIVIYDYPMPNAKKLQLKKLYTKGHEPEKQSVFIRLPIAYSGKRFLEDTTDPRKVVLTLLDKVDPTTKSVPRTRAKIKRTTAAQTRGLYHRPLEGYHQVEDHPTNPEWCYLVLKNGKKLMVDKYYARVLKHFRITQNNSGSVAAVAIPVRTNDPDKPEKRISMNLLQAFKYLNPTIERVEQTGDLSLWWDFLENPPVPETILNKDIPRIFVKDGNVLNQTTQNWSYKRKNS